jgi:hypothetical protein
MMQSSPAASASQPPPRAGAFWKTWGWLIVAFLVARLAYGLVAAAVMLPGEPVSAFSGHEIFQTRSLTVPDWGRAGDLLVDGWFRWDTGWYLKIAALGYSAADGTIIFPPLYPLLVRWAAPLVGGNFLLSALLVSSLCALGSMFLLQRLALDELGSLADAQRAVIYLLAFPSAFYLFAGYTEALFLFLSLASWLLAARRRWVWAGLLAALASLTRLQGWAFVIPLGWLLLVSVTGADERPLQEIRRALLALPKAETWRGLWKEFRAGAWGLLLPLLALFGYMLWLRWSGLGDINTAYSVNWHMDMTSPWQGARLLLLRIFSARLELVDWIDLGLMLLYLAMGAAALLRLKPAFSLYIWASFGLVLMRGGYSPHLVAGFMRYMLVIFPFFLLFSIWGRRRWVNLAMLPVFLLLQLLLLWLFLNWLWVA